MKTIDGRIKFFIAATIITCILAGGFSWKYNKTNEKLIMTQNELTLVKSEFDVLKVRYQNEIEIMSTKLSDANTIITDLKNNEYELVYIGNYKLTHYCCEKRQHICGTGTGLTATGTQVTAGRTVAVDPTVIPYGTEMYIEGYGWRIAEDCGGAVKGNHIDIAVETHSKALSMGKTTGGVWLLVKKGT